MSHFMVTVMILSQGGERRAQQLVMADSELQAVITALECQCHDTEQLEWEECQTQVYDWSTCTQYRAAGCVRVLDEHVPVLGHYLTPQPKQGRGEMIVIVNHKLNMLHFASQPLSGVNHDAWYGVGADLFKTIEALLSQSAMASNLVSLGSVRTCGDCTDYQAVFNR